MDAKRRRHIIEKIIISVFLLAPCVYIYYVSMASTVTVLHIHVLGNPFPYGQRAADMLRPEHAAPRDMVQSPVLSWLRNLLYPPLVGYASDDLRDPTRRGGDSPVPEVVYRSTHLDDLRPSHFRGNENASSMSTYHLRFAERAGEFQCADGRSLDQPRTMEKSFEAAFSILRKRGLGLVGSSARWGFEENGQVMRLFIDSWRGRLAVENLILGHAHLFGSDYAPCGPFAVLNSDRDSVALRLNVSPATGQTGYYPPGPAWPRLCGTKTAVYRWRFVESATSVLGDNPPFDLLIAPYDPYERNRVASPVVLKRLILPVRTHFFAAFGHGGCFADPAARRAFYHRVLRRAVSDLTDDKHVVNYDAPAEHWFPKAWRPAAGNAVRFAKAALPGGFPYFGDMPDDGPATLGPSSNASPKPVTVVNATAESNDGPLFNALMRHMQAQNLSLDVRSADPAGESYGDADVVIFSSKYDTVLGDATQLLRIPLERLDRVLAKKTRKELSETLQSLSLFIFHIGHDRDDVSPLAVAIQQQLTKSAEIVPLYAAPTFVFYRRDVMTRPQLNARDGFINLDQWGLNVGSRCPAPAP